MRKSIAIAALLAGCLAASPAAATITLNFENIGTYGVNTGIQIENFYDGGTASNGATGTNFGVSFATNALTLCLNTPGTNCSGSSRGGQGDPTSAFTGLYFAGTDTSTYLTDAAGFTSGISLFYVANQDPGSIQIFSGINGTGTLLGTLALPTNATGCGSPYNALFFCPFSQATLTFSGTAKSVVFNGTANQIVFDDIVLGFSPLPEPGTWLMMLFGFGAVGVALRRKRLRLSAI